jgi:anion-transporting  ArsA/GET3 family ATPase
MTIAYLESHAGTLPQSLPALESRRFLFVTGKGGVGKTTVSGALALAFAARGKRVLVAMCNTKERLSAILGTKPIGDEVAPVTKGVWAVNISPDKALREYGEMVLKVRAAADLVFDNKYTRTFFRAVPGLSEWSMLGKAWFHTTELQEDGSPRYDVVLLDAPATGHGTEMLRVPKVILDVAPPGVLRRDAEAAWSMFQDPQRSGVVVVTLPEEMPATETVELISTIRGELRLPVHRLIVNGVLPPLFSPEERRALLADPRRLDIRAPAESAAAAGRAEGALVAGARRAMRESVQHDSLLRLRREIDVPMVTLPFLFDEASTAVGTRVLAARL